MRTTAKTSLIVCAMLLACSILFVACGRSVGKPAEEPPVKMTATYVFEDDNIYGMSLQDWDFEVWLHWSDGTKKKTKEFEIVNEDRELSPADSVKTYTLKSTEYGLTTTVDVAIPGYQSFSESREEFCQKLDSMMKSVGITQYTMEYLKDDSGNITGAHFKTVLNGYWSYWYFLEFSTFPYDPQATHFDRVKLDANVQYDVDEMEKMKLLLISLTIPADTYTAADAYDLIRMNDGKLTAGNVEYLAYFTPDSDIVHGAMYYLAADIVQAPCTEVNADPDTPSTDPATSEPHQTEEEASEPDQTGEETNGDGQKILAIAVIVGVIIALSIIILAARRAAKKKKSKEKAVEILPPAKTAPAAPEEILPDGFGDCIACGAKNVPVEDIEIMIAGTSRRRTLCADCAAKYK